MPEVIPSLPGGEPALDEGVASEIDVAIYNTDCALDLNADDNTAAAMKQLAKAKRAVEKDRKDTVKPYQDAVKTINKFFREHTDTVDMHITRCKNRLNTLAAERAKAERERLEAERRAQDSEEEKRPTPPIIPRTKVETSGPKLTTYTKTTLEITDESAIPLEYLVPDLTAIKKALMAGKIVPGAVLHEEQKVKAV